MRFITMGSETLPTLLFIHGLSATAESCYGTVGRLLQNNWHIVLCELDGHYEESPAFTSMKYVGIYWTLFTPLMKKSIRKRFSKELADRAIRQGKSEYRGLLYSLSYL